MHKDNRRKKVRDSLAFGALILCFGLLGAVNMMMRPTSHSIGRIFDLPLGGSGDAVVFRSMCLTFLLLALPAVLVVRRYGFKNGVVMGLMVFAAGTLTFIPATQMCTFGPFVLGYTLILCGSLLINVSATPYVLTYGSRRKSLFRLLLCQTMIVVGWLVGNFLSCVYQGKGVSGQDLTNMMQLDHISRSLAQREELLSLSTPLLAVGAVATALIIILGSTAMFDRPQDECARDAGIGQIFRKLLSDRAFLLGTVCQLCYMTAQTLCWSSIISYGVNTIMETEEGLSRTEASATAVEYVTGEVIVFGVCRLIWTIVAGVKTVRPSAALKVSGIAASVLCAASLFLERYMGLLCMIGVSAFMSIMYPTIYYLSVRRQNISGIQIGTAFQVMCVMGGLATRKLMPTGDNGETVVQALLLALFGCVAAYGWWCQKRGVGALAPPPQG